MYLVGQGVIGGQGARQRQCQDTIVSAVEHHHHYHHQYYDYCFRFVATLEAETASLSAGSLLLLLSLFPSVTVSRSVYPFDLLSFAITIIFYLPELTQETHDLPALSTLGLSLSLYLYLARFSPF